MRPKRGGTKAKQLKTVSSRKRKGHGKSMVKTFRCLHHYASIQSHRS